MKRAIEKYSVILLLLVIVLHGFILTKLIYFPYPELFIYPYLTNHGLKPYSQILDQHFPGLLFLPINFDNLGMTTPDIARLWSIGIVIINQLLIFLIGKKILGNNFKALLANLLYLIWQPFFEGWVLWIDNFLPIFLLPSFWLLNRVSGDNDFKKTFLFCLGIVLGSGIVFKQTLLPLSGLILLFLIWKKIKLRLISFFLVGLAIPIVSVLLYLLSIGVLKDFWYWSVIFNLTTYAKGGTTAPPTLGFITRILLVYGSAVILILPKVKKGLTQILLIFLIGSLAGVFDRADFVHFQPSLPFAILATILGIEKFKNRLLVKSFLGIYILITLWWLGVFYRGHLSSKVFFYDEQTKQLVAKVKNYTNPQEKIFVFGVVPSLYQMTNTLPAGNIFVFQFPWFMEVAQERILQGIVQDQPKIIVSDRTVKIGNASIVQFASKIDQYIQSNYQVIDNIGKVDILRKKNP